MRVILGVLTLLAALPALAAPCPHPTASVGQQCVLVDDARLTAELILPPGTQLNCRGHKLLPTTTGVPERSDIVGPEYARSVPETAIVIVGSHATTIQNCVIGDEAEPFDFGVLVLESKAPAAGGNRIVHNVVTARYGGITLVKSDDNHVAGNHVVFGVGAHGRGIAVYRDADRNLVEANTIEAHSIHVRTQIPTVPQGPIAPANNPANSRGINSATLASAILRFDFGAGPIEVAITRAMVKEPVVGTWLGSCDAGTCTGDRAQICNQDDDCSLSVASMTDDWLSSENVYAGNRIDFHPENKLGFGILADQQFGIVLVGAVDSTIRENQIRNANEGIHFGAAGHDSLQVVGACRLEPSRRCTTDAGCAAGDTCRPPKTYTMPSGPNGQQQNTVNIGAQGIFVAANVIRATDQGINVTRGSQDVEVAGNDISGGNTGLVIRQNGVASTVVRRNLVHRARFGLVLDEGTGVRSFSRATRFSEKVSLNDLDGNERGGLSVGVCANFPLSLSCADATDCDNSCGGDGLCARTGEPCGSSNDCVGPLPLRSATGDCLASFHLPGSRFSDDDRGNFWGLPCAEGGFVSPDPALIDDDGPYGQPVAELPDDQLPATCR